MFKAKYEGLLTHHANRIGAFDEVPGQLQTSKAEPAALDMEEDTRSANIWSADETLTEKINRE